MTDRGRSVHCRLNRDASIGKSRLQNDNQDEASGAECCATDRAHTLCPIRTKQRVGLRCDDLARVMKRVF